jgi:hypothetical protein
MHTPIVQAHTNVVSGFRPWAKRTPRDTPPRVPVGPQTRRPPRPSGLRLWRAVVVAGLLLLAPLQGFADFWTGYTSEEYPPVRCHQGGIMSGVACDGRYCDNMALLCSQTYYPYALRFWGPFISEEAPHSYVCPSNGFITALDCNGRYCDNLAVECTALVNRGRKACYWTAAISEEGAELIFPAGYYAAGLKCTGSYCDNVAFYVCQVDY